MMRYSKQAPSEAEAFEGHPILGASALTGLMFILILSVLSAVMMLFHLA
jgi:hypothetical protein